MSNCKTCGGVVTATPVDTSQFPEGSLTPVENACVCGVSTPEQCATKTACTTEKTCVTVCEEDHTKEIIINNLAAAVKTTNAFNWPAIGSSAQVKLVNVTALIPGHILWNQGLGRLHVTDFDADTRIATVTNLGDSCVEKPAVAGQLVPSCTEFAIGIPACSTGAAGVGTAGPFLAADFTAPGSGSCVTIKVTSIIGLALNDVVSIASFQYRVDEIFDTETIKICDDGEGAPLGQVFEWDSNCDDVPDVPILPISGDNPCSKAPVAAGKLVVCDNGQQTTLEGQNTGQVPIWDDVQEKFTLISLNLADQCTFLEACFTVDVGDDGPYLITVNSTSIFTVSQQVRIDGDLFTIDSIEDDTHMRVIPDETPAAIKEYAENLQVCLRDCCEFLPEEVNKAGFYTNIISVPFNFQSNRFNIEAGMVNSLYENPDNDFLLLTHTNNTDRVQSVELHMNVIQAVTLVGADKALSEVHIVRTQPTLDDTSIAPRALAFFDSVNVNPGDPPTPGFFNEASGWVPLNAHSSYVYRPENLQPGETCQMVARHRIAFNALPGAGTNHFLFLNGNVKVIRKPI